MKINIELPTEMLEAIDKKAKESFFNRSEWIRTAIRDKLLDIPNRYTPATSTIPERNTSTKGTIPVENKVKEVPTVDSSPFLASTAPQKTEEIEISDEPTVFKISEGWCQGHFEKGVNHKRYLISWEDENGDLKIDHKWYCIDCLNKVINLGKGKIYGK